MLICFVLSVVAGWFVGNYRYEDPDYQEILIENVHNGVTVSSFTIKGKFVINQEVE